MSRVTERSFDRLEIRKVAEKSKENEARKEDLPKQAEIEYNDDPLYCDEIDFSFSNGCEIWAVSVIVEPCSHMWLYAMWRYAR